MKIVPYEPWHLKAIQIADETPEQYNIRISLAKFMATHHLLTGIIGTDVVAISGLIKLWKGVCEATIYTSYKFFDGSLSLRDRKTLAIECKRNIRVLAKNLNCHRVQATVQVDFKRAIKFAKFIGFHEEGVAKLYGPDKEDYMRFVMFPEVEQW